jgi:hypothetical protein
MIESVAQMLRVALGASQRRNCGNFGNFDSIYEPAGGSIPTNQTIKPLVAL